MANKKDKISSSISANNTEETTSNEKEVKATELNDTTVESKEDKLKNVDLEVEKEDGHEDIDIENTNDESVNLENQENNSIKNNDFDTDIVDTEETTDCESDTNYTVVYPFRDLEDKTQEYPDGYIYRITDEYPRQGVTVDEERIQNLMSINNKIGKVLIAVKK